MTGPVPRAAAVETGDHRDRERSLGLPDLSQVVRRAGIVRVELEQLGKDLLRVVHSG